MMTAIAMLPGLLPEGSDKESLKSFYLPFHCLGCFEESKIFVTQEDLAIVEGSPYVNLMRCPICGNSAVVTEANSEFLYLFA